MVLDGKKPCIGSIRGLNIAAIKPMTDSLGATKMQQWDKEPTLTGAMTSGKEREDTEQDPWGNYQAGDCEAYCQIFHQDSKNEGLDIVEGSATAEIEKEITREVTANLGRAAPPIGKKMVMKKLDRLAL
jgi:hypothetical protein